ncbi:MAG: hypothetical protein HQK65_14315 [Desulfamplus sp.]|nr:hypothetical protein [Desulfamplus sp.]
MSKNNIMHTLCGLLLIFSLTACATSYVEEDISQKKATSGSENISDTAFPQYSGPKTVVAVLPLGLSERAAKRYPHLLKKSVGMGIHNMVMESLFDSGRFRFVEEKPEIIKEIIDRQWMNESSFTEGNAVEYGKMLGAEKVIYGEVYDYAEGGESVTGLQGKQNFQIVVGVQIIYTDITTGEKIAFGSGRVTEKSYGDAAQQAINKAVISLIRRLN